MEADLQRFYGVDLAGLWTGALSIRRLSVYIANLPIDSAVWAVENGLPMGVTPTDVLLADIFQAVSGHPHPLRPAPAATGAVAKARHETTAVRLRAQRVRVAQQRGKETTPSV